MYSILIRDEKDAAKWSYALDENEAVSCLNAKRPVLSSMVAISHRWLYST